MRITASQEPRKFRNGRLQGRQGIGSKEPKIAWMRAAMLRGRHLSPLIRDL